RRVPVPGLLDLGEFCVAHLRQIDAGDFGADCGCDRLDRHRHDRLSRMVSSSNCARARARSTAMKKLLRSLATAAALLAWCGSAYAEASQVRFARQLGLGY